MVFKGQSRESTLSRRRLIQSSGIAASGLAAAALIGCGDDDDDGASDPTASPGSTGTAAPGGQPTAEPGLPVGGDLVAVLTEGADLNPHTGVSGFEHAFLWMFHDNLVAYDHTSTPDPARSLAESWETPSTTEIVLHLKDGVVFHDGEPLTSEVIKYNLDLVRDPDSISVARGQLGSIDQIETPDDKTVVLKLSKPDAALLALLGDRGGMVVSRKTYEELGPEQYALNPNGGSGPFKFERWTRNDSLEATRFAEHWRKDSSGQTLPYVDSLRIRFLTEAAVQVAALEAGEVHITPVQAQDIARVEASGASIQNFPGASVSWGKFNTTKGPVDDPRVRRAIAYAIDRQTLADALTEGTAPVALGPVTPAQWAFNPDLTAPSFDLSEAKKLIEASGVAPGTTLTAVALTGDAARRNVELWQQMLKEIGLELQVDFLDPGARTTRWRANEFHMNFTGFSIRADPHGSVFEQFHSSGGFAEFIPSAPDVDKLLEDANSVFDFEERKALYNEAEELIAGEYAMNTFTYYTVVTAGLSRDIQNGESVFGGEGKYRFNTLAIG